VAAAAAAEAEEEVGGDELNLNLKSQRHEDFK